jgi:hypothetical protein
MNVKWDHVLSADQIGNPILLSRLLVLPESIGTFPAMLSAMFPSNNHSLKTWGRTAGVKKHDPHWIGVRKQTPLHRDPAYPRYSHQIIVSVDPGFVVRGLNKETLSLQRGTFFIVDTHSPHQLYAAVGKPYWYLALSWDADEPQDADTVIAALLSYGSSFEFSYEDHIVNN